MSVGLALGSSTLDLSRLHYFRRTHPIIARSEFRRHRHHVAFSNVAEGTEESIAMGGENHISWLSWQSRAIHMADAMVEDGCVRALKYDGGKVEFRDLHPSDESPVRIRTIFGTGATELYRVRTRSSCRFPSAWRSPESIHAAPQYPRITNPATKVTAASNVWPRNH